MDEASEPAGPEEAESTLDPRSVGEARPDRQVTMQQLERAALELMREGGVLAGLNLRSVADRAGVNRGLVYMYFGSRRALLRSSLRRRMSEVFARMRMSTSPNKPSELYPRAFRETLAMSEHFRTIVLLLLDDDRDIVLMPELGRAMSIWLRAQQEGVLDPASDPRDMIVFYWSFVYGYHAVRQHLARELGYDLTELDGLAEQLLREAFLRFDGKDAGRVADGDGTEQPT
jgi:AcrR family transcriptional regulator